MNTEVIKVGDLVVSDDGHFGEVVSVSKKTAKIKIKDIGQENITLSETEVRRPLHQLKVTTLPKVKENHKENKANFEYTDTMKNLVHSMTKNMVELISVHAKTGHELQLMLTKFRKQVYNAIKKEEVVPFHTTVEDSTVAQVDALTDTLYFIVGSFVEMGVTPEKDDKNNLSTERYPNEHRLYHQVAEFHKTGGHPVAENPKTLTVERLTDRLGYTVEELVEFIHSVSHSQEEFQKNVTELSDVVFNESVQVLNNSIDFNRTKDSVKLFNSMHEMTLSMFKIIDMPSAVFGDIVHNANMTKFYIDENGDYYAKIRESDGKIMKSPDFEPPEEKIKAKVKEILASK